LTNDRILDDRIAEVVNHRCDRKNATEPLVQVLVGHQFPPRFQVRGWPLHGE
jgi:hypothetical protein